MHMPQLHAVYSDQKMHKNEYWDLGTRLFTLLDHYNFGLRRFKNIDYQTYISTISN